MRGTTLTLACHSSPFKISIHVPRAGDDPFCDRLCLLSYMLYFNPRPPCGGRQKIGKSFKTKHRFQSTSPVRGTTKKSLRYLVGDFISIHVPRAGDDYSLSSAFLGTGHFNPRPPCGGRQLHPHSSDSSRTISIHVPRAGDDTLTMTDYALIKISIHVPRAGDDSIACVYFNLVRNFNPRPPCGGRHSLEYATYALLAFQSTSPVRGTTYG